MLLSTALNMPHAAHKYAILAHAGQRRKYTNLAYITHPEAVALRVSRYTTDVEVIAAAYLHDVVEDCGKTVAELHGLFGARVANLVYWLTDVSKPEDGNRAARKALDAAHMSNAPVEAQLIKCCDLMDNLEDIVKHDLDFARVYLKEKKHLLDVMTHSPNPAREDALRLVHRVELAMALADTAKDTMRMRYL